MREMTIEEIQCLDSLLGWTDWNSLAYASEWYHFFLSGTIIWAVQREDHVGAPHVWHML